ncbi:MAG: hypothetical protein BroJett040_19340 [Oligoflexia bacterium]|nr:MAG: hypothetical protein BroJett040_19340 [Oligoflexia bacterium]
MGLRNSILCSLLLLTASCAKKDGGSSASPSTSVPESSYCSGTSSVSGGVTITSTAQYTRYNDGASGLNTTSTRPIRYAEVQILDSSGNVIQCGETDSAGAISLVIPKTAGTYTLKVNSRADNNYVKASILNSPTANQFYSISSSFSLSGTETTQSVTLTSAPNSGTLEGGAFNILDQVYIANSFLRNNTACATCTTFTVAPKISIYWSPGVNPGQAYLGYQATQTISFFSKYDDPSVPRGLYILGGYNGSVCVDTDHFDNSVILHEYGHFLEDVYASSDSQGGSHDGNSIVDPRLAWSEGWANYFQAAAQSSPVYYDTIGNSGCGSTSTAINLDLDHQGTRDVPTANGEGVFREVSVSRTLYTAMAAWGQDGYAANVGFPLIWYSFSDSTYGIKNTNVNFRNSGLFFEKLYSAVNTYANSKLTNLSSVLSYEYQPTDEAYYGKNLTAQTGATCTFSYASGVPVSSSNSAYMFKSNKFFEYYYDGTSARSQIILKYSAPSNNAYDLDLYVYVKDYIFESASTLIGYSEATYPESGASGYEIVNLSGKPAGTYMINVQAYYQAVKNTTTYYLETTNGDRLCP